MIDGKYFELFQAHDKFRGSRIPCVVGDGYSSCRTNITAQGVFHLRACASPASTGTLTARGADTHLI